VARTDAPTDRRRRTWTSTLRAKSPCSPFRARLHSRIKSSSVKNPRTFATFHLFLLFALCIAQCARYTSPPCTTRHGTLNQQIARRRDRTAPIDTCIRVHTAIPCTPRSYGIHSEALRQVRKKSNTENMPALHERIEPSRPQAPESSIRSYANFSQVAFANRTPLDAIDTKARSADPGTPQRLFCTREGRVSVVEKVPPSRDADIQEAPT